MRKVLVGLTAIVATVAISTGPASAAKPGGSYRPAETTKITTSSATVRFSCPVESQDVTVSVWAEQRDVYSGAGQSAAGSVSPTCTGKLQTVVIPLTDNGYPPLLSGPVHVNTILDGLFCPSCGSYDTLRTDQDLVIRK